MVMNNSELFNHLFNKNKIKDIYCLVPKRF